MEHMGAMSAFAASLQTVNHRSVGSRQPVGYEVTTGNEGAIFEMKKTVGLLNG